MRERVSVSVQFGHLDLVDEAYFVLARPLSDARVTARDDGTPNHLQMRSVQAPQKGLPPPPDRSQNECRYNPIRCDAAAASFEEATEPPFIRANSPFGRVSLLAASGKASQLPGKSDR
jgi:hypothetical protein